jgi:hypothetical protein
VSAGCLARLVIRERALKIQQKAFHTVGVLIKETNGATETIHDCCNCFSLQRGSVNATGHVLNSDALPFGRLWYGEPNAVSNAIGYAKFRRGAKKRTAISNKSRRRSLQA